MYLFPDLRFSMKLRATIDKFLSNLLVLILSILVLDVLWQVATRYLLSDPSKFTDELAGYLLIWVGLLGAAFVTGRQQHLAIDLLVRKKTGKQKSLLMLTINFFIFLFALSVMIVGGIWLVYTRFYLGQTSAALEIPLGYVYMVLPLSGLFIVYFAIDNSIPEIKNIWK